MDILTDTDLPDNFRYKNVFRRGKPVHEKFDSFSVRHPAMPLEKRAKIFSPFDALKGFNEAIASKEVIYESRRILSEEDMQMLDEKLNILLTFTINGKTARANRVSVEVTYFSPIDDPDTVEPQGRYLTASGILRKVDDFTRRIVFEDDTVIPMDDIIAIDSPVLDVT